MYGKAIKTLIFLEIAAAAVMISGCIYAVVCGLIECLNNF